MAMEGASQELRSEARLAVQREAFIRYKFTQLDGAEKLHASRIRDISLSGIKIVCHEPVPIGQILDLNVIFSDDERVFVLIGRVQWCLELDNTPTYSAGVCLIDKESSDFSDWKTLFDQEDTSSG
ncbi:PilZ domain-containing protein [Pleionea sp. CnH1-48]|uniref:PilZ domain-containing protein n=1 Tax=Pleionea sp. CnH1-48 TaxID=2954494 RepID=UPI00209682EF|nr:PilZ domain-containing protein [Pleionea sp. CnH1-48]MCO7225319.1 PilZ domain-containing protein [Pleionea sp. CnH1-48]